MNHYLGRRKQILKQTKMFPLIVTLVQQSNLWSYFGLVLNGEILKKKFYLLIAPTKTIICFWFKQILFTGH